MTFEPIAIVGQACVLPGALSPDELWRAVVESRDLTSDVGPETWQMDPAGVRTERRTPTPDKTWCERGGYVHGFAERFDPAGFAIAPERLLGLDPIFQWLLHGAREALRSAGLPHGSPERGADSPPVGRPPVGLVLGNLCYPAPGFTRYAERVWARRQDVGLDEARLAAMGLAETDPLERFCSGYPAHFVVEALNLGGEAFALDAACASALYAIKLACDQLHDRRADVMLAGAVNRADDLFLHVGFCALNAMSKSGRSRPFDAGADGLIPAEGAAFVVLKRLSDAIAAGDEVLGVIRGVGLSNDGRSGGFLAPSEEGQERALRAAWEGAGLDPSTLSLLECHATGTPVGDAVEVRSAKRVFGGCAELPLGSLKSNTGHLIATAGMAGLIKVLGAFKAGIRPPTRRVETLNGELEGSPFRLLQEPEPWDCEGPRRAAISAFGFGGNNAHLIVDEWTGEAPAVEPSPAVERSPIAIIGVEVRAGGCQDSEDLAAALWEGPAREVDPRIGAITVEMKGLRFPPRDLEQTLPQQLLALELARTAASRVGSLPAERTAVLMGMGADAEIARYAARWRLEDRLGRLSPADRAALGVDDAWLEEARERYVGGLSSAGVLGTMPNIPANRINAQLNLSGPSFSVASEELSGVRGLAIASRALRAGEIDAALVGAVDLSVEPVHGEAIRGVLGEGVTPGDAGCVLVLKRLADAERDGDRVLALLDDGGAGEIGLRLVAGDSGWGAEGVPLRGRFGHAHAASGLLHVAAAALALRDAVQLDDSQAAARPWTARGLRRAAVEVHGLGGQRSTVHLRESDSARTGRVDVIPQLEVYSGASAAELRAAVAEGRTASGCGEGPARLVLRFADAAEREQVRGRALERLSGGLPSSPAPMRIAPGVVYAAAPLEGERAFVFTGAAAAYPGMGRELLRAFPELMDRALEKHPGLVHAGDWLRRESLPLHQEPFRVLQGQTLLSQLHAVLSRELLGLGLPDAVLGVSSGETNSIFAIDAWSDLEAMFEGIDRSGMYQTWIAGEFRAARESWGLSAGDPLDWGNWRVLAPVEAVKAACAEDPRVRLTMINTDNDCVIAGEREACKRVLTALGNRTALLMGHDIVAHAAEMKVWEKPWYDLHHRRTAPVPGLRIYSNASGGWYEASADAIATALTDQATDGVDFRRVVEAAWQDGVRIFIEHGPRGLCSGWINEILGDRPHLAVPLDRPRDAIGRLMDTVGELIAAGIAMPIDALRARLAQAARPSRQAPERPLRLPAHAPEVVWPARDAGEAAALAAAPAVRLTEGAAEAMSDASEALAEEGRETVKIAWSHPRSNGNGARAASFGPSDPVQTVKDPGSPAPAEAPAAPPRPAGDEAKAPARGPQAPIATGSPIVDGVARFHAGIAEAHRRFLGQQSRVVEAILGLRSGAVTAPAEPTADDQEDMLSTWTVSGGSAPPVAAPVPAAPVPAAPVPAASRAPAKPAAPVPAAPVAPAKPAAAVPAGPSSAELIRALDRPGPKFDREQLKVLASGKISAVLGELFKIQDDYPRQVRMPEPPLLLADRVTGIDAEPGSMGKGTIWTETDVEPGDWYLHNDHMPVGIMIESGQADLLLISWLGADFENRGERVYRLLGCELTFHKGGLPRVGDTLVYDIHVDGYAKQGPIRLFFFHYDCRIDGVSRLSVRHGQAGFFSDAELAESAGILWTPETGEWKPDGEARMDAAPCLTERRAFTAEQVTAFAEGDVEGCFGEAFRRAACHVRTPRIQRGRMQLFDDVPVFDPQGGPKGRGYLRAEKHLTDDEWFYTGHFKNDSCMPGTIMFEGSIGTMAFYMAALGVTLERDGYRFEPVEEVAYQLRCRGQVIPGARELIYEVFVEEFIAGPEPILVADLLCTVDGLKAFHCRGMQLRLTPSYPLDSRPSLMTDVVPGSESRPIAVSDEGHRFDFRSLAACAWGRPSEAFGPFYRDFDGVRQCPRLPGAPYHFMTRISALDARAGVMVKGGKVEVEYDIPPDAWYFSENGRRTMPFCVLLEAALQPCGWLASYIGCAANQSSDVRFRNLDGTGTLHRELGPEAGTLVTRVTNTGVSKAGPMIIVNFEVACLLDGEPVYDMTTVFGFFPPESLAAQAGLPLDDAEKAQLLSPAESMLPLAARPARLFAGELRLPGPMLMLLDRVTGLWPEGGDKGLGRIRAEIDVDPRQWFFKCHFFEDPVQPGSLGIEAMIQLVQAWILETGKAERFVHPRFESLALGEAMTWKYRGQVLTHNDKVVLQLDVEEEREEDGALLVSGTVSYLVDGMKIYEATNLGVRVYEDSAEPDHRSHGGGLRAEEDEVLDPAVDLWLGDHRPTWTVPALAMMSMVDRLVGAAKVRLPGRRVTGLKNVRVHRWLGFADGARRLKTSGKPFGTDRCEVTLSAWEEARGRFEPVAVGEVLVNENYGLAPPRPLAPIEGELDPNPYEGGRLFHGPAYQALRSLTTGANGSSAILDADPGSGPGAVPFGSFNQRLLDALTHGIPHDRLHLWSEGIAADQVAYPIMIPEARFYAPIPRDGELRVEARFVGFTGGPRFPTIALQVIRGQDVLAELTLVEALFPKGPLGCAEPADRIAFLRDGVAVPGLALSSFAGDTAELGPEEVKASDWLEGSLAMAYQASSREPEALARELAVKESVARRLRCHPREIRVDANRVWHASTPLRSLEVEVRELGQGRVAATPGGLVTSVDRAPLAAWWRDELGTPESGWLGEDLLLGLVERYVGEVRCEDGLALEALRGRGALFLANHQVGVESVLFGVIASALLDRPTAVLAKAEHAESWIGRMLAALFRREGITDPGLLVLVERSDQQAMLKRIAELLGRIRAGQGSVLIHVEGTRSLLARKPVETLSASVVDGAVMAGVPIVPVRFLGGLPVEPLESRLEFPLGHGRQRIHFGAPLLPEVLVGLPSRERRERVVQALDTLGGVAGELPGEPQTEFAQSVRTRVAEGLSEPAAVLRAVLASLEPISDEGRAALKAAGGEPTSDAWLMGVVKDCLGG